MTRFFCLCAVRDAEDHQAHDKSYREAERPRRARPVKPKVI